MYVLNLTRDMRRGEAVLPEKRTSPLRLSVLLGLLAISLALLTATSSAATGSTKPRQPVQPTVLATPLPRAPAISATVKPSKPHAIMMEVTAYCSCKICCGRNAHGITASGRKVSANGGAFVAADADLLDFNTKLIIPGYKGGKPVPVLDRGGDIVGRHIDVFFPTHREAQKWGRKLLPVTILD